MFTITEPCHLLRAPPTPNGVLPLLGGRGGRGPRAEESFGRSVVYSYLIHFFALSLCLASVTSIFVASTGPSFCYVDSAGKTVAK